jgi:DNA-directed RNA polymerase I, II, and III subunit RPABC5
MIIPVRCFECGKLIADKWRGYQRELKRLKQASGRTEERIYFEGTVEGATRQASAEKQILDKLNLNQCCRTHFLTQVDLIEKI